MVDDNRKNPIFNDYQALEKTRADSFDELDEIVRLSSLNLLSSCSSSSYDLAENKDELCKEKSDPIHELEQLAACGAVINSSKKEEESDLGKPRARRKSLLKINSLNCGHNCEESKDISCDIEDSPNIESYRNNESRSRSSRREDANKKRSQRHQDYSPVRMKTLKSQRKKRQKKPPPPEPQPSECLSQGVCSNKQMRLETDLFNADDAISLSPSVKKTKERENQELMALFASVYTKQVRFEDDIDPSSDDDDKRIQNSRSDSWRNFLQKSWKKVKSTHKLISTPNNYDSSSPSSNQAYTSFNDDECGSVIDALTDDSSASHYSTTSYDKINLPTAFNMKSPNEGDIDDQSDNTHLSRVDASMLFSLRRHIQTGDFLSHTNKYDQAIKNYLSAYNIMMSLEGCFSKNTFRKMLGRLNDVYHTMSIINDSSKIMKMGIKKENNGEHIRALKYYTVAYRLRRGALGDDHITLVVLLNNLADVQTKRKEYKEALVIYNMAISITKKNNPRGREPKILLPKQCTENSLHLFTPPCLSILLRGKGAVQEQLGDLDDALHLYHESLKVCQKKRLSLKSPKSVTEIPISSKFSADGHQFSFHNININLPLEPNGIEVSYAPKSMYDLDLGKDDIDITVLLHNIGHVQWRLGRPEIALLAFKGALQGMKIALGVKHQNVAAVLGNIANIYKDLGKYDMAIKIYQRVLRIESETLGEDHTEITVTLHNMGTIEYFRKNYAMAAKFFLNALKILNLKYGRDHSVVGVTSSSLGEAYEKMNEAEAALRAYRNSLRVCTANLGANNADVAKLLHKIGSVFYESGGDYNVSLKYCMKSLDLYRKNNMAEEHPLVMEVKREIANMKAALALSTNDRATNQEINFQCEV